MASVNEIKQKILDRLDKLVEDATVDRLDRIVNMIYSLSNMK